MSAIVVCPLSDLQRTVDAVAALSVLTVISPDMPVDTPCGIAPDRHLTLHFNDVVQITNGLVAATHQDIERMIAFIDVWDKRAPMVIHCWLGVSRSTAAALTAMCRLQPDRPEFEIAQQLRFAAPFASPNLRIVSLADKALGRDGRLIDAATAIGRGEDCWQGQPFSLELG